jgi:NitT/TauT family transport system ATP-binding protein
MKPIITIKNVSKKFDDPGKELTVLKDIDLTIHESEFLTLVGPSGSGKSTILRIISGLEKKFDGEVIFGDITKNDFSFVFQEFALLPWLTIYKNIELGLITKQLTEAEKKLRVERELKRFDLEKFAHSRTHELSGGQRQRVGVARALATDPKVIFMDEPFSELDSFTAEELRGELLQIWQERKPTIVMVTHIIEDAIELSDRIAVLSPRPGQIEKVVENHLPRPRAKRSPEFFKLEDEIYKLIKP